MNVPYALIGGITGFSLNAKEGIGSVVADIDCTCVEGPAVGEVWMAAIPESLLEPFC